MNTYDSGRSTSNEHRHEAFNNGKDANGIPRCRKPESETFVKEFEQVTKKPTGTLMREYEFKNDYNQKITIRQDPAREYYNRKGEVIGSQPPHFNVARDGKDTGQHHTFK